MTTPDKYRVEVKWTPTSTRSSPIDKLQALLTKELEALVNFGLVTWQPPVTPVGDDVSVEEVRRNQDGTTPSADCWTIRLSANNCAIHISIPTGFKVDGKPPSSYVERRFLGDAIKWVFMVVERIVNAMSAEHMSDPVGTLTVQVCASKANLKPFHDDYTPRNDWASIATQCATDVEKAFP